MGGYYTEPGPQGQGRIFELKDSLGAVTAEGNRLDSLVVAYLKQRHALNDSSPSNIPKIARLNRDARQLKEALFRDCKLIREFEGNLNEFRERREVQDFVEDIRNAFKATLEIAAQTADKLPQRPGVRIILTGGGASLPFVKDLAGNIPEDPRPTWISDVDWSIVFPQLAVALGGAMPQLPEPHFNYAPPAARRKVVYSRE